MHADSTLRLLPISHHGDGDAQSGVAIVSMESKSLDCDSDCDPIFDIFIHCTFSMCNFLKQFILMESPQTKRRDQISPLNMTVGYWWVNYEHRMATGKALARPRSKD
ncbi:hypothetical protein ACLKA6_011714 [Drosophila palustris]